MSKQNYEVYNKDMANMVCRRLKRENKNKDKEIERLHSIIKEVRKYITGYESISTIQGLDNLEIMNEGLDYKTIEEITNRYLKVHDKILEILDKENKE